MPLVSKIHKMLKMGQKENETWSKGDLFRQIPRNS